MNKLKMHTQNTADENFTKLATLFPNAITETIKSYDEKGLPIIERTIDADVLAQEINAQVVTGKDERYQFSWPDKKKSILLANSPLVSTLRPCRVESVDFDNTQNLYIEGDNLDVLKLLHETYLNKIKMIYIDPPYNTGKNYIYKNNFHKTSDDYMASSGQFDDAGNLLVPNYESNGQFHTDWLNMMYQRIRVAKYLLAPDGVFVCAIDENEFPSLALMLRELFGEVNYEHSYVSVVHNPRGQQGLNFSYVNEYLIFIYPKDGKKYLSDFPKDEVDSRNLRDSGTESNRTDAKSCFYPFYVKDNKIIKIGNVPSDDYHPKSASIVMDNGELEIWPISETGDEKKWRYARHTVESILGKLEVKMGRTNTQIVFNKDEGTMRSVWANARYDSSEYGTKLLDKLFGGASFTFPKSLYAVYDCVMAATKEDKDAIVLDFFSGSATTAHAVMQLNAVDNGKRKFIMVQLPEDLDQALLRSVDAKTKSSITSAIEFLDSIGKKHDICSIGEERIRRAGAKIKEEMNLEDNELDTGFRVLKLDSSNMKDVYYTPEEYTQMSFNLEGFIDNIKFDRTEEDLLFQVMLDLGISLSSKIIQNERIFNVDDNYLIACFDKIDTSKIIEIAKMKPYFAVFRDNSFVDDSALVNIEQVFNTYSPNTKRMIL